MRTTLLIHILTGSLGLISGYVALSATKGAPLHRKSGTLFVWVMLTMSITGMLISAVEGVAPAINIPTALLTFYLVVTSLAAVRSRSAGSRRLDIAGMLMAAAIALGCVILAARAMAHGGRQAGMAFPLILFGGIGLSAGTGDLRMIRAGGVRGAGRLARHLWRMCVALFIASIAFYLGPGRVPEALRIPALLAGAVLLPIVVMSYWLWRLRVRQALPSRVASGAARTRNAELAFNPKEQAS